MLLAIDVGNTQTVIGLYRGADADEPAAEGTSRCEQGLLDHWRIATNAARTADEHALVVQEFLGFHGFSFDDDIDGIVISSVVPRATAAFREMTERYFGFRPVVIEPGVRTGMPVLTDNPREVGADRIANAVAAIDVYGGPAVVIDFGTATTYDAISADGELLGCAIAPGIDISLDALYQRADALRRIELVEPRSVVGRTTVDALQAGAIYGFAGQVDGIVDRMVDEVGDDATILATGGLASLIAPYTRTIEHIEPWLTLHGLRLVFAKNL
ncbi:type III pantothenate kinase [Iamia majanohamensis]|uniref:Type III pantothenate kinase n=1 Tax=Iamia majanohamensis TaxID=467976 RepID=A0AAE9YAX6_9ACTN|nr:type III pantothenate kinase [Iamia majanohamensis]WCO67753.1 type III pantothenate kinase [Iamia majanohamensis]